MTASLVIRPWTAADAALIAFWRGMGMVGTVALAVLAIILAVGGSPGS